MVGGWVSGVVEARGGELVNGIVKPLGRYNPLWANVHYYVEMARLAAAGRGLERLRAWGAPPEWRPRALGGSVVGPGPARRGPSLLAPAGRAAAVSSAVEFALVVAATSYLLY